MSKTEIKLNVESNIFGTSIVAESIDGSFKELVCENIPDNPMKNHITRLKSNFMFRCKNISVSDIEHTMNVLSEMNDKFNLQLHQYDNMIYSLIKFKNKEDMTIFAWKLSNVYEKWDDVSEKEFWKSLNKKPKSRLSVDKNGNAKIKVTVVSLAK